MLRKGGEVPLPRPKKGEGENIIARPEGELISNPRNALYLKRLYP